MPYRPARSVVLTTQVVAAVVSLTILLGSGWAWAAFRSFSSSVTVGGSFVPTTPKSTVLKVNGKDQNILLLGDDSRVGATQAELRELGTQSDGGGDNTDTIMLLHLPANGSSASLMSFPRDSLVTPAGHTSTVKINSIYAADGVQALAETITSLTGLPITHYIKIGMLGFLRISHAINGVDITMCEAQNASTDSTPDHPQPYTGINLKKGLNRNIEGSQALAFVRQRHGTGLDGADLNDYTRIARQRYFLGAAFKKIDSASTLSNPLAIQRLLKAVGSSLTVDQALQDGTNLLAIASQMQSLTSAKFSLATIPMIGAVGVGDAYQGEQIDTDALPAFVASFVGQPSVYAAAHPVARSSVTVTVFNGGRANGSATAAATALKLLGFRAAASETDVSTGVTQIKYPNGMQAAAKTLAAAVPGAVPVLTHTVAGVQLVLGADQAHVVSQPAPAASPKSPPTSGASSNPVVRTAADSTCIQ